MVFSFILSISTPAMAADDPRSLKELKFECLVLDWDTISVDAGNALSEALEEIGVELTVNSLDDTIYYDRVYSGGYYDEAGGVVVDVLRDYQIYEMSSGYTPSPNHVYVRAHSSQDYDNGDNHAYIHNSTLDGALEKSMNATSNAELKVALNDVQTYCAEQLPYIPLFVSDDSHLIRNDWLGYVQVPGGIFTSFNPWTFLNMSSASDNTFNMAYPSDVSYLNVFDYVDERSGWVATGIYDTLIAYDDELTIVPWLAESYLMSADGLKCNFTLRTGVQWHDGEDLTPDDVKYTIDLTKTLTNSPRYSQVEYVDEVIIDGQVISVTFTEPYAWALDDIGTLKIIPQHIWEPEEADISVFNGASNATLHVGSGPYVYQTGTQGGPYTLVKNANYWYAGGVSMPNLSENPLVAGTYPKIDTIVVTVEDTESNRVQGMNAGTYDSERYETSLSIIDSLASYPNLKLVNTPSQWDYYMMFNMAIYPLSEIEVRQAIHYALDRDAIAQQARGDYATVTDSVIPECFFPDYYNPNVEKYSYNVDKANQMLDDAGFIDVDDDGIREVPGETKSSAGFEILVAFLGMFAAIPIIKKRK